MALPVWAAQWRFGGDVPDDNRDSRPPLRIVRESSSAGSVAGSVDEAVIARLRNGDEQALAEIFHAYYDRLCTYAMRIVGSRDLAESAVLDVMTSFWDRRERLEIRGTLRAYLTGAVRLRSVYLVRRAKTEWAFAEQMREAVMPEVASSISSDTELREHEMQRVIRDAVVALPPRCREVFELSWYGGLSYAEMAETLGISQKGIEAQMARAYRSLRMALASLR